MSTAEDHSTPFAEMLEHLQPVVQAHGFRLGAVEQDDPHALAEFWRKGLRLRLVWEGVERALWVDTAPDAGAQVIGRWQDVEWIEAGERLPLDRDLGPERMAKLLGVVERFLAARPRRPGP